MRKVATLIFVVTALIFGINSRGLFAYDDQTTHPALTDEIVDFYNLSFSDKKLTAEQKEWIVEGAILEDTPPRWINHFYDPIYGDEWTGEKAGTRATSTMLNFATVGFFTVEPLTAVNWIHNREAQGKYLLYQGDRTWEKALEYYVNGDEKNAYRTLGHVLHLLEDQSVPDHTRNDTHAHDLEWFTGDYGSPYEEYLKKYDRKKIEELDLPNNLKKEKQQPITKQSIEEYLVSLATYSNKYFFSKDTINDPKYQFPKILKDDGNLGYGKDEIGEYFNLAKINETWNQNKLGYDIDYYIPISDKDPNHLLILDAYFSRLSRQALLYGAGAIDLFKKQAEEAKEKKIDLSYSGSWFDVPMVSVSAAVVEVGNLWSSLKNTANTVTSKISTTAKSLISDSLSQKGDFATTQTASLVDAVSTTQEGVTNQNTQQVIQENPLNEITDSQFVVNTPNASSMDQSSSQFSSQINSPQVASVFSAIPVVSAPAPAVSQAQTVPTVSVVQTEQKTQTEQETPQNIIQATSTPEVVADVTAPVITMLGENPATVLVGGQYADLGATALDDIDGSRIVSASSTVNTFIEGDYAVSYTASDLSGNSSHATRTVNVVPTLATFSFSDLNNNTIVDCDEAEVHVDMNTVLPAGEYRFNNLTIASSSTLTLQGDPLSLADFKGVKIVAQNITVDAGSAISADYQGYKTGGPGSPSAPAYLAGASYGGVGTGGGVPSYGDALTPTELGSNGGVCCSNFQGGGGAVNFIVSGTFLNNGIVSANGSGSSSGGSIYGVVDTLAGSGIFQANGGAHSVSSVYHGRAGGGRTAMYYQASSFSGESTALGGCSSLGMGYPYECAGNGTAGLFDMKNNDLYISSSWRFQKNDNPFNLNRIVVTAGAHVAVEDGVHLTAQELLVEDGSAFSVLGSPVIAIPKISIRDNSTLTFSGNESLTVDTFTITENSTISVVQWYPLSLHVRNLTLSADSKINLDNKGYSGGEGPGAPIEFYDGASYGGAGYNNSATSTYGSLVEPVDMGSGGNGHHSYAQGGGALKIVADGTLILDGVVSARGGITSSGGSIYLVAHRLEGSGQLVVDGGGHYWQGYNIGMGGGGRIAVTAEQYAFLGSMSALGGCARFDGWTTSCAGNGTIENSNELEFVTEEEVPTQEEENATPVVLDTTPPVVTIGEYDSITATSSPITVTATTSEGVLNAESHTFTENGSFDFVATDDAGNTATSTVTIENIDITPPSITSYTLNGSEGNVEMSIASSSPVILTLNASEDVDWVSLRIENEADADIYKVFYSGSECVDGTTVCTKVWDTSLSKGEFIEGIYRVKVHFRDTVGNDVTEYLEPYVIIVQGVPIENEGPAPVLEVPEPVL